MLRASTTESVRPQMIGELRLPLHRYREARKLGDGSACLSLPKARVQVALRGTTTLPPERALEILKGATVLIERCVQAVVCPGRGPA